MDLLNDLIRDRILVQAANEQNIQPSEEETEIAIEQMLVEYGTTESELQELMEEQGYTEEMIHQEVADQLKIQKLTELDHLDFQDFDLSGENLRDYYDE
ncbi:SurA N-terminal domain-containing protein, partial [Pseudomonas sp. 2995-1]|uniref:SurA N-terminal domain-containing protein n=1 Tax=Pseudomonas sp. 2995-1 TaxID=1712679 RepID=UPI000C5CD1A1